MANPKIKQLPSGNYNALVYAGKDANGKRKYKSLTAPTKREVKLMIAEFLTEREMVRIDSEDITVGDAICRYIQSVDGVLSPSTIVNYWSIHKNRFGRIKDARLSELTTEMVQQSINDEAKHLSPKTISNAHALLSSSLRMAQWKPSSPIALPQKIKPDINIPTDEEVKIILDRAKGTQFETPFRLAVFCGMRRSEIMALKWSEVDLKKERLTILAATVPGVDNKLVRKEKTKETESKRTIVIFKPALDHLKTLPQTSEFVVTYKHPNSIEKALERILKQTNLPHYRFHDMRHYCVSSMLALNIPKKYIANYVGHASENMIDRVYGHIMENKKSEFMVTTDEHFSRIFGQMQNEMQNDEK